MNELPISSFIKQSFVIAAILGYPSVLVLFAASTAFCKLHRNYRYRAIDAKERLRLLKSKLFIDEFKKMFKDSKVWFESLIFVVIFWLGQILFFVTLQSLIENR